MQPLRRGVTASLSVLSLLRSPSSLILRPSLAFAPYNTSTCTIANQNSRSRHHIQKSFLTTKSATSSESNDDNMSEAHDEVQAAKEAAKTFSSADKAGPDTVFDKILSGEWPSKKVHEDDLCLAFRDIQPQSPTHVLVIPKHRDGLTKLSHAREDQKALLGHLMFVAQEIGKKECPNGFRVVVNDGADGAQSVFHLHLHVMGGRQMRWPPG